MHTSRHIDSCIESMKQMLGDPNNEMTSEQRNTLMQGVRELKRLRRARNFTREHVFTVVSRITEVVYEIVNSGVGA